VRFETPFVAIHLKKGAITVRKEKVLEIESIVENMINFQRMADEYNETMKNNIDYFSVLAYQFLENSMKSISKEDYLCLVKDFVIELNKLNEKADCSLIETDEREQIYSFIENISEKLGYVFDYDITEEVREW
jgi:formylmethanofuran dehydrogenase subunit B